MQLFPCTFFFLHNPGWARFHLCRVWTWSRGPSCYYGLPGCWCNQDHWRWHQPCKVWESQGVWSNWVCEPQWSHQTHSGSSGGDDWRWCRLLLWVHWKCENHGETCFVVLIVLDKTCSERCTDCNHFPMLHLQLLQIITLAPSLLVSLLRLIKNDELGALLIHCRVFPS